MSSEARPREPAGGAVDGGGLFVLSAASGSGKTTLVRRLFEHHPEVAERLAFSVSHTSRPPRPGEVDGRDYYFVSEDEFQQLARDEAFLEWAVVHGQLKGTSLAEVERLRAEGKDVLLEIDIQGAAQVRRKVADAASIFVLPPSYGELERRLRRRGSESETQLERRLADAVVEMAGCRDYDYVIVNDDLSLACEALAAIFLAGRFHRHRMQRQIARVLGTLPDDPPPEPTDARPSDPAPRA